MGKMDESVQNSLTRRKAAARSNRRERGATMINPNGKIRMGWLEAFGLFGVTFLLGMLVAWNLAKQSSTPELVRDSSAEPAAANRQFAERLARAVPIGSSDEEMIEFLSAQGFKLYRRRPLTTEEQHAVHDMSNIVCAVRANVAWRVDTSGRVTSMTSRVGEEGCW